MVPAVNPIADIVSDQMSAFTSISHHVMIIKLHNDNITIWCVECTNGYYGAACINLCGHCFGLDVCFHTNGSCPGNCRDGYIGRKCTDRELYTILFMKNLSFFFFFLFLQDCDGFVVVFRIP